MKAIRLLQGLLIITCIVVPTRLYRNIGSKYVTTNGEIVEKDKAIVVGSGKQDENDLSVNKDGEIKFQGTKIQIATVASIDEVKPTNSFNPKNKSTSITTKKPNAIVTDENKKSVIDQELEFRKFRIPIVIFCSYRPTYMARLLNSMKVLEGLNADTVCLFACQKTPMVSTQDVVKTKEIINQVKVCKAKTFLTESRKRNAKEYKKQWYNIIKLAFENPDIFDLGYKYPKDILFLEDDIELSKDALKAIWFMLKVKNSNPNTIGIGLGGWSGEHLVNPHPDTFVIRVMLYFPGMAYSFNASIWKEIQRSKFLSSKTNDWSEAIAWMWPGRYNVVVPTLGRMWHIGERGLGKSGDGRKKRILQSRPGWLVSPRLMNLNTAIVNAGVRDIFGMYCDRKYWQKHLTVPCLCPTTKAVYPNKKHFNVVCVDNSVVYDKCIGRDP